MGYRQLVPVLIVFLFPFLLFCNYSDNAIVYICIGVGQKMNSLYGDLPAAKGDDDKPAKVKKLKMSKYPKKCLYLLVKL